MNLNFLVEFFKSDAEKVGQGCLRLVSDESAETDFSALCERLSDYGFICLQKTEASQNLFATYEYKSCTISVSFIPFLKRLMAVYDPFEKGVLPPLKKTNGEIFKNAEISMLTLAQKGALPGAGMSFVLTLRDGEFIVIDGGYAHNAEGMLEFLKNNTKGTEKPHVIAWIITHGHTDHIDCLLEIKNKYFNEIRLDSLIACPYYGEIVRDSYEDLLSEKNISEICDTFGAEYIRPHFGQRLYLKGAIFDIFHTAEEEESKIDWMNFASLVFMVTIGNKKIFFPTDYEKRDLAPVFKEALKCDILQVTHHGWSGGTKAEYDFMEPDIAFFPIGENFLAERIAPEYPHAENHYLIGKIKEYYADNGENITIKF